LFSHLYFFDIVSAQFVTLVPIKNFTKSGSQAGKTQNDWVEPTLQQSAAVFIGVIEDLSVVQMLSGIRGFGSVVLNIFAERSQIHSYAFVPEP